MLSSAIFPVHPWLISGFNQLNKRVFRLKWKNWAGQYTWICNGRDFMKKTDLSFRKQTWNGTLAATDDFLMKELDDSDEA